MDPSVVTALVSAGAAYASDKNNEPIRICNDILYMWTHKLHFLADKTRMLHQIELERLYAKEINNKYDKIPIEKRIEPQMAIIGPALDYSQYCLDTKEIRTMFENLITNSMNIDYEKVTHPSFCEVIKQLSLLDAQIVCTYDKTGLAFPLIKFCLTAVNRQTTNYLGLTLLPSGYDLAVDLTFIENIDADPMQIGFSLRNLSRLGVIELSYEAQIDTSAYERIYKCDSYIKTKEYLENNFTNLGGVVDVNEITPFKGATRITPYGKMFINACVSSPD